MIVENPVPTQPFIKVYHSQVNIWKIIPITAIIQTSILSLTSISPVTVAGLHQNIVGLMHCQNLDFHDLRLRGTSNSSRLANGINGEITSTNIAKISKQHVWANDSSSKTGNKSILRWSRNHGWWGRCHALICADLSLLVVVLIFKHSSWWLSLVITNYISF
jgi:hypothetical protein